MAEGEDERLLGRGVHQHIDPPHLLALPRARRDWPRGCRTTEERDELTSFCSMTSSASVSVLSYMLNLRAFAVFNLISNSNLVGRSTEGLRALHR
jgi:hypothetical protein